jgi:hypothetical protein
MIVPPRASHPFGISMVRDYIAIARKLFVANRAFPILLNDLAVQELSHLSGGSEFPISSWVMRILNALHAHPYYCCLAFLSDRFPAAAG